MIDVGKLKVFHAQLVDALTNEDDGRFHQLIDGAETDGFDKVTLALVAREALIDPEERADHLLTLEVYRVALGVTETTEGLEPAQTGRRRSTRGRQARERKPHAPSNGLWQDDRLNAL